MGKNIVLLSDGTGNSSAKLFKTNVWRTYQALDLTDPGKQIAYYDNGVGTSSFKPLAILGGVFGVGLKRNVIDIYSFCCRNYQPGDRVYGFGFSRGAFTIRVVAGFIARIGLVPYDGNEAHLARDALIAYRQYRKERNYKSAGNYLITPLRGIRDWISQKIWRSPAYEQLQRTEIARIEFVGVWDTVAAYGGPVEEITRAIDIWFWPLSMPDTFMTRKIGRACHALALEEERDSFQPVIWDDRYVRVKRHDPHLERDVDQLVPAEQDWSPPPDTPERPLADIDRERISQVWFVGVHSDVGGGYAQDGLSYTTLAWMMARAEVYGLSFLPQQRAMLQEAVNALDKLNDSRHGISGYYRYRPRKLDQIYGRPPYNLSFVDDLKQMGHMLANRPDPETEVKSELVSPDTYRPKPAPKIHHTVFDRVASHVDGYAPIVLPETYSLVGPDGSVALDSGPRAAQAHARVIRSETVWDKVWLRRVIYFATVFASLYLALLPAIEKWWPGRGPASPAEFVVPAIDAVRAVLPGFTSIWLDAFERSPGRFVVGAIVVAALLYLGGTLQAQIRDTMRAIWRNPVTTAPPATGSIYRLRNAGAYKVFFHMLKHWVLPGAAAFIIAIVILYALFVLYNRTVFAMADLGGAICHKSQTLQPIGSEPATRLFATSSLCAPTGLALERGRRYEVTLEVVEPWFDASIPTDPGGFGREKMSGPMWLGLPLRRLLASNWFLPVLRVGSSALGEVVPTWQPREPSPPGGTARYVATFKAPRSGELFVYVNDAVLAWPGQVARFYVGERGLNRGTANLTVSELPK